MSVLAGKPVQYLIMPDPIIGRLATIASVTSEAGQHAGGVVPGAGNRGLLLPVQSGSPTVTAVDADVQLVESGGVNSAEWIWKRSTDGSTDWLGQDDPRRMWGFHCPRKLTPYSDNVAVVYSSAHKTITAINVAASTNIVTLTRRDIETTRYDEWTHTFGVTENDIESGDHNCAMIELPDGTLMLALRTNISGTADFDIYHSTDGGASWFVAASQILARFDSASVTHSLASQIRMARSGEWIRLCWMNSSGAVETRISTDRGMSWRSAGFPSVVGTNGDTDDPQPFSLIALDHAGTFLLRHLHPSTLTDTQGRVAVQDGDWSLSFGGYDVTSPQTVFQVVHARKPGWVYEFIYWSDTASPASVGSSGWTIRRVRAADAADPTAWEESQVSSGLAGVEARWGRVHCVWAGNAFFFYGARKSTAGVDQNLGMAMYLGGWTKLTWGGRGQGTNLSVLSSGGTYDYLWHCESSDPATGTGTPWIVITGGTATAAASNDRLQITGSATADTQYYELNLLAAESWGFAHDASFSWRMQLDSGDSTVAADDAAVRFFGSDGTDHWDVSIRIGPTSVVVFDNVALTTVATLAITNDGAGYTEFRFWIDTNRSAQLHVYDSATGSWSSTAVFTAALFVSGPTFNTIRFGHLGQTQATQMVSRWREFGYTRQTRNQDGGDGAGFVNPDSLLGMPAADRRIYLSDGMYLAWAGGGGADGDTFTAQIDHRQRAESVFTDSPRIDWRSGGSSPQAAQTMILDTGTDRRFTHDAIALFGINDRTVLVDYDDNASFTTPSAAQTVDATVYNTGSVPLSVALVDGTSIRITSTNNRFIAGEAAGYYVRMTSGTANGKTFKITRHIRDDLFEFDGETDLFAQGVAASDTLVVFASWAALTYSAVLNPQRYMRLRFSDSDTAEGDHRLGHIVVGSRVTLNVPMDWSNTDDEQPNVSDYQTVSAVSWRYEEGPPQRRFRGRLVGDATQRQRDRLRALLSQISYVRRPVAWVPDEDQPVRGVMLARVTSGSRLDQATWYLDVNSERRQAGDLSIILEEVV